MPLEFRACAPCNGTGDTNICPSCTGTGQIWYEAECICSAWRRNSGWEGDCDTCGNTGVIQTYNECETCSESWGDAEWTCQECHGTGQVTKFPWEE
ncbi:hypothetical protein BJY04DRAFT_149328 [Aspergillus karnatakaensis]|uniref:uncharacterized protein n=1 Tax=Aspergillus karnatakaensis TaxID=1810916 RepID=UPI003CCD601F